MSIIKRYSNRKLYDTGAKRYVTLEQVAAILRDGQEIQVIDNSSGEDITALVLTQIITDQEKKRSGVVPRPVLANLIQAGGDALGALQRTLGSPIELWRQVDREIESRIQELVQSGDLHESEGLQLRDKLLALTHRHNGSLWLSEQDLRRGLAERGVPTRDDLDALASRVEKLASDLEALGPASERTGRRGHRARKPAKMRRTHGRARPR